MRIMFDVLLQCSQTHVPKRLMVSVNLTVCSNMDQMSWIGIVMVSQQAIVKGIGTPKVMLKADSLGQFLIVEKCSQIAAGPFYFVGSPKGCRFAFKLLPLFRTFSVNSLRLPGRKNYIFHPQVQQSIRNPFVYCRFGQ